MTRALRTASARGTATRIPSSSFLRELLDHYRQTGSFRRKDLRRVLGKRAGNVDLWREIWRRQSPKKR